MKRLPPAIAALAALLVLVTLAGGAHLRARPQAQLSETALHVALPPELAPDGADTRLGLALASSPAGPSGPFGARLALARTPLVVSPTLAGEADLALRTPPAETLRPLLMPPAEQGPGCRRVSMSLSDPFARTVSAALVVVNPEGGVRHSLALGAPPMTEDLGPATAPLQVSSEDRYELHYADRAVTWHLRRECEGPGRRERLQATVALERGWNLVRRSTRLEVSETAGYHHEERETLIWDEELTSPLVVHRDGPSPLSRR